MALYITSLNSGSNGNCYYIGNDTEAVLIDAGLSCRETEKRMQKLRLGMDKVKAIFISHEHTDHIKGVQGIADKYAIPVYITADTLKRSGIVFKNKLCNHFSTYGTVHVGRLIVTAFPKKHDAADPHSFIISCDGTTVGVFTDIGKACDNISKFFSQCHAAFLESNYDEAMLENGSYPHRLKNRIRSGEGHLSNRQALEIFTTHRPPFMTHLFLAHLSKENNHPQLVKGLFDKHAGNINVVVASRYQPTDVYLIGAVLLGRRKFNNNKISKATGSMQLDLFEQLTSCR